MLTAVKHSNKKHSLYKSIQQFITQTNDTRRDKSFPRQGVKAHGGDESGLWPLFWHSAHQHGRDVSSALRPHLLPSNFLGTHFCWGWADTPVTECGEKRTVHFRISRNPAGNGKSNLPPCDKATNRDRVMECLHVTSRTEHTGTQYSQIWRATENSEIIHKFTFR